MALPGAWYTYQTVDLSHFNGGTVGFRFFGSPGFMKQIVSVFGNIFTHQ